MHVLVYLCSVGVRLFVQSSDRDDAMKRGEYCSSDVFDGTKWRLVLRNGTTRRHHGDVLLQVVVNVARVNNKAFRSSRQLIR